MPGFWPQTPYHLESPDIFPGAPELGTDLWLTPSYCWTEPPPLVTFLSSQKILFRKNTLPAGTQKTHILMKVPHAIVRYKTARRGKRREHGINAMG